MLSGISRRILSWPATLVAGVFAVYALLFTAHSIYSWSRMVEDAERYLLADVERRVTELGALVQRFDEGGLAHADVYEIQAFLQNRDLGMSMRYGLGASLLAVEHQFKEHLARSGSPPDRQQRILYFDNDGGVLVDTAAGSPVPGAVVARVVAGREGVWFDARLKLVMALHRVRYKNDSGGMVVSIDSFEHLLQPMRLADEQPWRELVLDGHGRHRLAPRQGGVIAGVLETIAEVASGEVERRGGLLADWLGREQVVVARQVLSSRGLQLVKVMPAELVYGHIPSLEALFFAAGLPLLMVWGGYRLDQSRQAAESLTTQIALSNQRRELLEQRNRELAQEIEQRELVEQALVTSEERWSLAISGANDGIWDWRPLSGEAFFSERWKRLLGYEGEEIVPDIGEKERRIHPDDWVMVVRRMQKHLDGRTHFYQCEYRMRHKKGHYIWVLERGRALHDEDGLAVRVTGSLSDITERRKAESQLEQSNLQLSTIFEISPDGMVSFGPDHRVVFVNPAFLRMTGLGLQDVRGLDEDGFARMMGDLCDEGCRFPGRDTLGDHMLSPERHEVIALRSPGRPVLDVTQVLSKGEGISRILFFRDVTIEIEVDRMKSEFVSTAAHELRTPLASIYGYAELLAAESEQASHQRMFAETIHREAGALASIIDELLNLARIESRRGADFVFEHVELGALVAAAVAAYPHPAGRAEPELKPISRKCWVRVDGAKINQCINNLLSNAYKYSPAGGAVEVGLQYMNGLCGIRVRDHGIGMTAQQVERIFERFYRADQSGAIPGTGLGMSIVKEIMDLHEGRVSLQAGDGGGLEVVLWLPERRQADAGSARSEKAAGVSLSALA